MTNLAIKGIIMKNKIKEFFEKENGDVNVISIVVLIAVAIGVGLLFKDKIQELVDTLFTQIGTGAGSAVGDSMAAPGGN